MEKELTQMARVVDNLSETQQQQNGLIQMAHIVKKKDSEEKEYLICIRGKNGSMDQWDIVKGRTSAYNYIKSNIDDIILEESFILVETINLSKRKSIYSFMKYAEQFYEEDNFDIEDHIKGDYNDSDFVTNYAEVDNELMIDNNDKLSMKDMMNNNFNSSNIE